MQKALIGFAGFATVAVVLVLTGCAGPEKKLGRGLTHTLEIVRLGEMNRQIEQTALFESQHEAFTTGVIRGFNRTVATVGKGLWEVVTFPIPPYNEAENAKVVFPDAYQPLAQDYESLTTDRNLGFSGGDLAPWLPGSRFRIFESQ